MGKVFGKLGRLVFQNTKRKSFSIKRVLHLINNHFFSFYLWKKKKKKIITQWSSSGTFSIILSGRNLHRGCDSWSKFGWLLQNLQRMQIGLKAIRRSRWMKDFFIIQSRLFVLFIRICVIFWNPRPKTRAWHTNKIVCFVCLLFFFFFSFIERVRN